MGLSTVPQQEDMMQLISLCRVEGILVSGQHRNSIAAEEETFHYRELLQHVVCS